MVTQEITEDERLCTFYVNIVIIIKYGVYNGYFNFDFSDNVKDTKKRAEDKSKLETTIHLKNIKDDSGVPVYERTQSEVWRSKNGQDFWDKP